MTCRHCFSINKPGKRHKDLPGQIGAVKKVPRVLAALHEKVVLILVIAIDLNRFRQIIPFNYEPVRWRDHRPALCKPAVVQTADGTEVICHG